MSAAPPPQPLSSEFKFFGETFKERSSLLWLQLILQRTFWKGVCRAASAGSVLGINLWGSGAGDWINQCFTQALLCLSISSFLSILGWLVQPGNIIISLIQGGYFSWQDMLIHRLIVFIDLRHDQCNLEQLMQCVYVTQAKSTVKQCRWSCYKLWQCNR